MRAHRVDSYPTPVTLRAVTTFQAKYSDEQREAVAIAYVDRKVRPAKAVCDLAARGELPHDGKQLEPFTIGPDAVRTYAARLRKGRNGQLKSGLTDAPPKDAIEALRIRLISAADDALKRVERRMRATNCSAKDIELARQVARLIREAAAIPGPNEARPVPPGAKVPGAGNKTNGGTTRAGLAGSILASHRGGPVYTPDDPPPQGEDIDGDVAENSSPSARGNHGPSRTTTEAQDNGTDEGPGSWAREQVAQLGA